MTGKEQELFTYQFTVNIDSYEPQLLLGMTFIELTAVGMAFAIPLMIRPNASTLLISLLLAVLALLVLKRIERFGNVPLPAYLLRRLQVAIQQEQVTLPQLLAPIQATIVVEDYEGRHMATYDSR